jgi:hypothetical protein
VPARGTGLAEIDPPAPEYPAGERPFPTLTAALLRLVPTAPVVAALLEETTAAASARVTSRHPFPVHCCLCGLQRRKERRPHIKLADAVVAEVDLWGNLLDDEYALRTNRV